MHRCVDALYVRGSTFNVALNKTDQANQINQMNQTHQTDQIDEKDEIDPTTQRPNDPTDQTDQIDVLQDSPEISRNWRKELKLGQFFHNIPLKGSWVSLRKPLFGEKMS